MPYQYSAENHDWDLTLRAAGSLLMSGQAVKYLPTPGSAGEKQFSCFVGSMLLSFIAVESFSASVAFVMAKTSRFGQFDFERYRRTQRFWDKIGLLCAAIPYAIDKSQGLFQVITQMHDWRNLIAHASPYAIATTEIENTTRAPLELHIPFQVKQYTRQVNLDNSKKFYSTALEYTKLITKLTDIEPRASVTYGVGSPETPTSTK